MNILGRVLFSWIFILSWGMPGPLAMAQTPTQTSNYYKSSYVVLRPESADEVFYHWNDSLRFQLMVKPGKYTFFNFRASVFNSGMKGAGLYLAKWPTSSQDYGPDMIEVKIPKTYLQEQDKNIYNLDSNTKALSYDSWYVAKINKILGIDLSEHDLDQLLGSSVILGGLNSFFRGRNPIHDSLIKKLDNIPFRFTSFVGDQLPRPLLEKLRKEIKEKRKDMVETVLKNRRYRWGCYQKEPLCLEYRNADVFISSVPYFLCAEGDLAKMQKVCATKNYKTLQEVLAGGQSPAYPNSNSYHFMQEFLQHLQLAPSLKEMEKILLEHPFFPFPLSDTWAKSDEELQSYEKLINAAADRVQSADDLNTLWRILAQTRTIFNGGGPKIQELHMYILNSAIERGVISTAEELLKDIILLVNDNVSVDIIGMVSTLLPKLHDPSDFTYFKSYIAEILTPYMEASTKGGIIDHSGRIEKANAAINYILVHAASIEEFFASFEIYKNSIFWDGNHLEFIGAFFDLGPTDEEAKLFLNKIVLLNTQNAKGVRNFYTAALQHKVYIVSSEDLQKSFIEDLANKFILNYLDKEFLKNFPDLNDFENALAFFKDVVEANHDTESIKFQAEASQMAISFVFDKCQTKEQVLLLSERYINAADYYSMGSLTTKFAAFKPSQEEIAAFLKLIKKDEMREYMRRDYLLIPQ